MAVPPQAPGIVLSDGQLPAAPATILTCPLMVQNINVILANTSASLTETITLTLTRQNVTTPTARRVAEIVLGPNQLAYINGLPMNPGDLLGGTTTDATTVDYTTYEGTGPYAITVVDANGSEKVSNTSSPAMQVAQYSTMNATTGTLAANKASGAQFTALLSSNATPGSQAMRTPAQILADTTGLAVLGSYILRVINTGAGVFTLATDAGTGFTMSGTMTVAQNTFRDFCVVINSATTGTITEIGTGTNS